MASDNEKQKEVVDIEQRIKNLQTLKDMCNNDEEVINAYMDV